MNIRWLCLISGGLLLLGILTVWPYSYYIFLRWIIFISSAIVAYNFYTSKFQAWALIFGATAFLFNPVFPIYLDKSTWVIFDFVAATLFFLAAYSNKASKHK